MDSNDRMTVGMRTETGIIVRSAANRMFERERAGKFLKIHMRRKKKMDENCVVERCTTDVCMCAPKVIPINHAIGYDVIGV